jgi:hypothetical protein
MIKPFLQPSFEKSAIQIMTDLQTPNLAILYTYFISGIEKRCQHLEKYLPNPPIHKTTFITPTRHHNLDEFTDDITHKLTTQQLIIIPHAQNLLGSESEYWLHQIIIQQAKSSCSILFFAEILPFQLQSINLSSTAPILKHQYWLPQLNSYETQLFTTYLLDQFPHSNQPNSKKIYQETGGHPWLTKEIIRQSSSTPLEDIITSASYTTKAKLLFHSFPEDLKSTLLAHQSGQNLDPNQTVILNQAAQLNIVFPDLTLPNYLSSQLSTTTAKKLVTSKNQIIINDVNVSSTFSKSETAVITYINNHRGSTMTRSDLAHQYWPDDIYTEWALDRAIFRLKKKLTSLGFPPNFISTIRGHGYQIME